eukprot:Seg552.7 transcript_id=Seg552.7/GoldUCD/mRNA.D3Y31 product="hypothetical protein" protein_id=Seg552.7/GoldUCD/D3Y31
MRDEKRGNKFQLISSGAQGRKKDPRRNILPVIKTVPLVRNAKSMPADLEGDARLSGWSSGRKDGEELMLQRAMGEVEIGRLKKPQVQVLLQQEIKEKDREIACQRVSLKKLQMDLASANNHIGLMKMEIDHYKNQAMERKSYIEQQKIRKGKLSEELKTARKQNRILTQQVESSERAQRMIREQYKLVVYEEGMKDSKIQSLEKKIADSKRVLVGPTCSRRRSDSYKMSLEWKCPNSEAILELPRRISCKSISEDNVTLSVDAVLLNRNSEQSS